METGNGRRGAGQAGAELKKAAGAIRGHEGDSRLQNLFFLALPEAGGNLGLAQGEDAAEAAALRRLDLGSQVITEGAEKGRRLFAEFELVHIVAGIMIIDFLVSGGGRSGPAVLSVSQEGREIVHLMGPTRPPGVEARIMILEKGMTRGTDGDDDLRVFFLEGIQVPPGELTHRLPVAQVKARSPAASLFRRSGHLKAQGPKSSLDALPDFGEKVLNEASLEKIGLSSFSRRPLSPL
jgi:hypothetical protein